MVIRTSSHRAGDKVRRALGYDPVYLFSAKYSGSYGLQEIRDEDWDKVKDITGVTKSRQKRESLYKCWKMGLTVWQQFISFNNENSKGN